MQGSTGRGREASPLFLSMTTPFGRRHPMGVAAIRLLVSLWLVALGIVALAMGYWWGVAILAAAVGVFWFAYNGRRYALKGSR
jgi:hypothetical protein